MENLFEKNNRIVRNAVSKLTDTEKEVIALLTDNSITKNVVTGFLAHYNIDKETAVTSFLINDLLDCYGVALEDNPAVSRIKGLKSYFKFHNATVMMKMPVTEVILDVDLCLRLRFSDTIRPFTSLDTFVDKNKFIYLFGKKSSNKIIKSSSSVKSQNREYMIPHDVDLPDIIYLGLYIALMSGNRNKIICYLYDIYRYCNDKKPSMFVKYVIARCELRNGIKRALRWLLR